MKATQSKQGTYVAPGLEATTTLRPEIVARIELLRIVWRPGMDAGIAMQTVAALEEFTISGRKPESR